ncbi:FAD-dependent oxidoreductase [Leisingera aquaemixtae]|uniref:FAD-dependent oxidoreductase n=1 Tax=Leisingera aquaemixtae TaxID=1396826 RepID=UPI0030B82B9A
MSRPPCSRGCAWPAEPHWKGRGGSRTCASFPAQPRDCGLTWTWAGTSPALWRGTRPLLPDMLPMAGQAPRQDRFWFHFGHSHHGVTLGPPTACRLADMMGAGQARLQVPCCLLTGPAV